MCTYVRNSIASSSVFAPRFVEWKKRNREKMQRFTSPERERMQNEQERQRQRERKKGE